MTGSTRARWLAAVVAMTLAGPPLPASAAPKAKREILEKVGALAQEAQTRFETADFAAAIELWTQAYAALPAEPAYEKRRNVLAYQIAQACVEAYALDPQLLYLRKAERLFAQYLETISAADTDTTTKVQGTLAELRDKIRAAEDQEAAQKAEVVRDQAEDEAAQAEKREQEQRAAARREAAEREVRAGRTLVIAGGAVAGVGALALGVMAYGLARGARVDRDGEAAKADGVTDPAVYSDLLDQGTMANRMAIATAAIGGVLVVTGVGLIGAGAAKQGRGRRELAMSPVWLGAGAGLSLQGRF